GNDGVTRASLEVNADEVEFVSPRQDGTQQAGASAYQPPAYQNAPASPQGAPQYQQTRMDQNGFVEVDDEELPF
ncbi:MAG: hypothetical protein IJ174_00290, partial [Clostridia bacterium]|nr:hypothetical protein [Clostridia bacterium]